MVFSNPLPNIGSPTKVCCSDRPILEYPTSMPDRNDDPPVKKKLTRDPMPVLPFSILSGIPSCWAAAAPVNVTQVAAGDGD